MNVGVGLHDFLLRQGLGYPTNPRLDRHLLSDINLEREINPSNKERNLYFNGRVSRYQKPPPTHRPAACRYL